jgi:hypothetical protein
MLTIFVCATSPVGESPPATPVDLSAPAPRGF